MKLPCETIRDLLPLYYDGVCSGASKALVEEHLRTCEGCAAQLTAMNAEMEMPRLKRDEARPLKTIRRKVRMRSILMGLCVCIAVLLALFYLLCGSSVRMTSDEFTVHNRVKLSDGRYYIEYSHPYTFTNVCADYHGTEDGEGHLIHFRPIWVFRAREDSRVIRTQIIDPEKEVVWYGYDKTAPITALYLGCPDEEEALLLWSQEMDIPMATPEQEKQFLG